MAGAARRQVKSWSLGYYYIQYLEIDWSPVAETFIGGALCVLFVSIASLAGWATRDLLRIDFLHYHMDCIHLCVTGISMNGRLYVYM